MPGIALLGTQWGDEGKGKVTHLMADAMDMVVRYQGGNNAGHTVIVGTETFKLHLLPLPRTGLRLSPPGPGPSSTERSPRRSGTPPCGRRPCSCQRSTGACR